VSRSVHPGQGLPGRSRVLDLHVLPVEALIGSGVRAWGVEIDLDALERVIVIADSAKVVDGAWVATQIRGQLAYDQSENGTCAPQAQESIAIHGNLFH
jgi:hypothetical protein